LFREILEARDCEIEEMEMAEDHVHIFPSIPPRYSVGEMVRGVINSEIMAHLTVYSI